MAENVRIAVCAPVWGTYSYCMPEQPGPAVQVGQRVLVPLRNRTVTGFVLSIEGADASRELKEVKKVFDEPPLFTPQMVPLFEWMADYYFYPPGLVIENALPAGLNVNPFTCAHLTPAGSAALEGLPIDAQERTRLEWVSQNPGRKLPWPLKEIESLARRGWVCLERARKKGRAGPLVRKFVRFKDVEGPGARPVLSARSAAPENEAVLWGMLWKEVALPLSRIREYFSNGDYLVRKWVARGVLEIFEAPVYRNPAGGELLAAPGPFSLNKNQEEVFHRVGEFLVGGAFAAVLLHGVTGSGKTEVYVRAAEKALAMGRQVIVMIPEIALAAYLEGVFRARFGDRLAVYHSGLSKGERFDEWLRMAAGEVDLVIGARSALFAPLPRPGLIVVDEEHDAAYKQDDRLSYNARDSAVMRAKLEQAVVLLGSGTPGVQSYHNARTGRYVFLEMPERVERRPLPKVQVVDMTRVRTSDAGAAMLSPELRGALGEVLAEGCQAMLFLNRRGFHRLHICAACGQSIRCPHCDVALTHHLAARQLRCHYCGFASAVPATCPKCGDGSLRTYGFGTQKLEQELERSFPAARVARMDTDNTRAKGAALEILRRFNERRIDILVGTQMITKGYDFPAVTLVGVIAADLLLNFPDFRAAERTFQVLSQVAGRAGRGDRPGRVIIQAFNTAHYAVQTAMGHDYAAFFEREEALRRALAYPPFAHLACLKIKGKDPEKTAAYAKDLGLALRRAAGQGNQAGVAVLGPVEAPIARIKGYHRWRILLKCRNVRPLRGVLATVADVITAPSRGIQVGVDVDPYQMI